MNLRLQIVQDLVVSEVAVCWKDEELNKSFWLDFVLAEVISVLLISFGLDHKGDNTLLDHNKLTKVLSDCNNLVLRQVEPRIDVAEEVTSKFTTSFELGVIEQVEEVSDEVSEKRINKSLTNSWLQLNEELAILNLVIIVVVTLLGIVFDSIIELFTKVLRSTLLKLSEPPLDLFDSLINNILK